MVDALREAVIRPQAYINQAGGRASAWKGVEGGDNVSNILNKYRQTFSRLYRNMPVRTSARARTI